MTAHGAASASEVIDGFVRGIRDKIAAALEWAAAFQEKLAINFLDSPHHDDIVIK